jgi:hypothetical protein
MTSITSSETAKVNSETSKVNVSEHDVITTSTTKALLLSITVPRVYRLYLPPKVVPVEDDAATSTSTTEDRTSSGSTSTDNAEETKEKGVIVEIPSQENDIGKSAEELPTKESSKEEEKDEEEHTEVGYVEDHDDTTKDPVVEHIVTQEEMAFVVKIDPNAKDDDDDDDTTNEDENAEEEKVEEKDNELSKVTSRVVSEAMKLFYGVMKKGDPVYMSKEEAVAVMKAYEPPPEDSELSNAPNTEIKVEALLRLTFRNMHAEGHFYNAPIYTAVQSPLKDGEDASDWIELSVMVKDSSIGIILERLERIGVGSTVGSIALYKAELCRTADIMPKTFSKLESMGEESNASKEDADNKTPVTAAARAEWRNAASRLRIEQVKEQIYEQATLSLDYLALLAISSILAGIGLITDSTVVIVASMLVSPIMVG